MDKFDAKYWDKINKRKKSCKNCGHLIVKADYSSTGWIHDGGDWEGIRCQNMLCGAEPAT